MKKVTLLLFLSVVGFMGYSQQSNQISNLENDLTILVGDMDFHDAADQELLIANDFSEINFSSHSFKNNTHELVHKSSSNNLEYIIKEGAFTYKEYASNFDYKSFMKKIIKY